MNEIKVGSVVRLKSCEEIRFTVIDIIGNMCHLIGFISDSYGFCEKQLPKDVLILIEK